MQTGDEAEIVGQVEHACTAGVRPFPLWISIAYSLQTILLFPLYPSHRLGITFN